MLFCNSSKRPTTWVPTLTFGTWRIPALPIKPSHPLLLLSVSSTIRKIPMSWLEAHTMVSWVRRENGVNLCASGYWDTRKGPYPVDTSTVEKSHRDPVFNVSWVQSKTGLRRFMHCDALWAGLAEWNIQRNVHRFWIFLYVYRWPSALVGHSQDIWADGTAGIGSGEEWKCRRRHCIGLWSHHGSCAFRPFHNLAYKIHGR